MAKKESSGKTFLILAALGGVAYWLYKKYAPITAVTTSATTQGPLAPVTSSTTPLEQSSATASQQ